MLCESQTFSTDTGYVVLHDASHNNLTPVTVLNDKPLHEGVDCGVVDMGIDNRVSL